MLFPFPSDEVKGDQMHPENHSILGIKDVYNIVAKKDFSLIGSYNDYDTMMEFIRNCFSTDEWKDMLIVKIEYPRMGINTLSKIEARMFDIKPHNPFPGLFEIIKEK